MAAQYEKKVLDYDGHRIEERKAEDGEVAGINK